MALNQTLSNFIKACSDDDLYRLFEVVIAEMNKRKTKEREKEQC